MSKLTLSQKVPFEYNQQTLSKMFKEIEQQVNMLSEGLISGKYTSRVAIPVAGNYKRGDFISNSNTLELGSAGFKYVVAGWVCSTAPLTFKECRFLTGN